MVQRAARAAAGTYRLARTSYSPDDVAAETVAGMLAEESTETGTVDLHPAAIAARARRVADRYRRLAEREAPAGLASEMVDGTPVDAAEAEAGAAPGNERRNAAMRGTKHQRNQSVSRADVLGVGDYARRTMRAAEIEYLRTIDDAATSEALSTGALSRVTRRAEAAAVAAVLAAADKTPPVLYVLGRRPVPASWTLDAHQADDKQTRREARRSLRGAEAEARTLSRLAALAVDRIARWDGAQSVDALSAAVLGSILPAALDAVERAENAAADAAALRLAVETGATTVAARSGVTWTARTVERIAPAADLAAVLLGAEPADPDEAEQDRRDGGQRSPYVAEVLADRRSENRPRGAVTRRRSISWTTAAPTLSDTDRRALARGARSWAEAAGGRPVGAHPVAVLVSQAFHVPALNVYGADRWNGANSTRAPGAMVETEVPAGPRQAEALAGGASGEAWTLAAEISRYRAEQAEALRSTIDATAPRYVAPAPGALTEPTGTTGAPVETDPPTLYGAAAYVVDAAGTVDTAPSARAAVWQAEQAERIAADLDASAAWRAQAETTPRGTVAPVPPVPPVLTACPRCLSCGRHLWTCDRRDPNADVAESAARRAAILAGDSRGKPWTR